MAELVKLVDDENFIGMYDYEKEHRKQMNSARYEGVQEGIEIGMEKGKLEAKKENAIALLKNGVSYEIISNSLGFSIEELKKLQEEVEDK